ncbi:hypothetical protein D3C71_1242120 [compost metagenome]
MMAAPITLNNICFTIQLKKIREKHGKNYEQPWIQFKDKIMEAIKKEIKDGNNWIEMECDMWDEFLFAMSAEHHENLNMISMHDVISKSNYIIELAEGNPEEYTEKDIADVILKFPDEWRNDLIKVSEDIEFEVQKLAKELNIYLYMEN